MIARFALCLVAACFLGVVPAIAQLPTDAEAKKKLVGTWTVELKGDDTTATVEQQIKPDGTFTADANISISGKKYHVYFAGTWDVREGRVVKKTAALSEAAFKPERESSDTLLEITDQGYRTRTESGQIEQYSRK